MITFRYRTGAIRVATAGPLAVAIGEGIVTPASLAEIIRDSAAWSAGAEPLAKVVDYSKAVLATDCEQMLASVATVQAAAMTAPAALVAGADNERLLREYAACCAGRGAAKAVFLRVEDAVAWAARQAQVVEYWRRCERAVQSDPAALRTVLPVLR